LYVGVTEDDYYMAFDALNAAFSYLSVILLTTAKLYLRVAITALAALES
jgi:hypothetical protein